MHMFKLTVGSNVEYHSLIANVSSEIDAQKAKKADYLSEALARREAFQKLTETLLSIAQYPRVDHLGIT
jgi:hypothetical protein